MQFFKWAKDSKKILHQEDIPTCKGVKNVSSWKNSN